MPRVTCDLEAWSTEAKFAFEPSAGRWTSLSVLAIRSMLNPSSDRAASGKNPNRFSAVKNSRGVHDLSGFDPASLVDWCVRMMARSACGPVDLIES